ncbi:MAG: hypothetical protein V1897_09080 [Pseudomonadota bacterium]
MNVIKAFEFNDAYFTLPAYDGSHQGNVDAWMKVVDHIRRRAPLLYKPLLQRVQRFNEGQTDEMDIVSTLLQENFEFDVHVIWRKSEATLHMFSMVSAGRRYQGIPTKSADSQRQICN